MASPRALMIKLRNELAELTKRVEALEAALKQREMAQVAMKEPKPAPKRRRPRKAS